jgi:glycerol-3-phosphate dehydrogenase
LKYTIDNESVRSLSDFFIRRTGMAYFDVAKVNETYPLAAEMLSSLIPLSDIEEQVAELQNEIEKLTSFPDYSSSSSAVS